MQLLMSAVAFARVRDALAAYGDRLDTIAVDASGAFTRDGVAVDAVEVDPEIFWMSRDLYPAKMLPHFFQTMLGGTRGRWVQGMMAGVDHPIFRSIVEKGIAISKSQSQSPAIAEYVLAHALSLIHPIAEQAAAQAAHQWKRIAFREVASTRWLVVGYGTIGQDIIARAAAFGAHIRVIRRAPGDDPRVAAFGTDADLYDWAADSDVVVLACPLNDATRHMANATFFGTLKRGSILINIGRGELIDDAALHVGLDTQQPAFAVLDVLPVEPLPADSWHWNHPQVRLTAHCSNEGDGVEARADVLFLANLARVMAGEPATNLADRSEVGL